MARDPLPVISDGEWLIENRDVLDRGEARWLMRLGRFEMSRGYEAEGHARLVDWLGAKLRICRSSAFEKVRLARQLCLRPKLAEALSSGRISYSAARAIARLEAPDPEVDEALIDLAADHSPRDLDNVVRYYLNHLDQNRPLSEAIAATGLFGRRRGDGLSEVRIVCTDVEADEINALCSMFVDRESSDESTAVDSDGGDEPGNPTESTAVDSPAGEDDAELADFRTRIEDETKARRVSGHQRLNGLLEALRTAAAYRGGTRLAGADRYLVHVMVKDGHATLADGTHLPAAEADRLTCDCSTVDHHLSAAGEPLWLDRKTRTWNTAQRRAALARDGGCRFPGCATFAADLHHIHYWERGGPTDITNGISLCERHHTVVHDQDINIEGDPSGAVEFSLHDVSVGTTMPMARTLPRRLAV